MTRWAEHQRYAADERDDTRYHERRAALLVQCEDPPYGCSAPAGTDCHNVRTGRPLEHQAAHRRRIEAGERKLAESTSAGEIPEQQQSHPAGQEKLR